MIFIVLRQRGLSGKPNAAEGPRRVKARERAGRAIPAPEANAEIPGNLDVCEASLSLSLSRTHIFYMHSYPPHSVILENHEPRPKSHLIISGMLCGLFQSSEIKHILHSPSASSIVRVHFLVASRSYLCQCHR